MGEFRESDYCREAKNKTALCLECRTLHDRLTASGLCTACFTHRAWVERWYRSLRIQGREHLIPKDADLWGV